MLGAHHCVREGSRGQLSQWAAIARHTGGTVAVQYILMSDRESSAGQTNITSMALEML